MRRSRRARRSIAALVVGLLSVALLYAWHVFPVSLAAAPDTALSEEGEAAAASTLTLPKGYKINAYATGLGEVRVMVLTPKGDLIVSVLPDRVLLLKAKGDGRSAGVTPLIGGLNNPSGLYLDGDQLYVAEEGRVRRYHFDADSRRVSGEPETVIPNLPHGAGHQTRTIKKGSDGFFYLTMGSSCNICIERNPWRAAMLRFKPGEKPEVFASGLRNSVDFDWQPSTGDLYALDNGRDWLGDDLPPDEVNRVVQGGFYGWPYRYGDNVPDPDYGGKGGELAEKAIAPAFELPAHNAPLGILFLRHSKDPNLNGAALVTEHGSWNRTKKDGYRVMALHWQDGKIGEAVFLGGFLKDGKVSGRPVGLAEAPDGTIFVSDDFGEVIWRITGGG